MLSAASMEGMFYKTSRWQLDPYCCMELNVSQHMKGNKTVTVAETYAVISVQQIRIVTGISTWVTVM